MSIVVVSGLPRSGTSLMMQMLEAGGMPVLVDDARPPDADNPRGYYEYEAVKRSERDTSWVAAAEGRAVKVVHRLLRALPEGEGRRYRVILMRRDLAEVMASQRRMLARRGAPAGSPAEEARLAEVMRDQLDEIETWARSRPDVELLVVEYAALVADPLAEAARIARLAGPGLDAAAMAARVAR